MGEIPIVSKKDVKGKVVLIRVDHNVIKKGKIDDPYRIERSRPTIDFVIQNGGYPVLMTHIGRPKDKYTGKIHIKSEEESVTPLVEYIRKEWHYNIKEINVNLSRATETGLTGLDGSVDDAIRELKKGAVQLLYLPNTRWFAGEELEKGGLKDRLSAELASIADIFVNDAFGSHQPHVSTYSITEKLPSFAGFLMMEEIEKLEHLLKLPAGKRPFFAAVAGDKIDTKIGALRSLRDVADNLFVGGLPANALICAKYGAKIRGTTQDEIEIAKDLLREDKTENKLLIPDLVVVSDIECSREKPRQEGKYREVDLKQISKGADLGHVYDVSPDYFQKPEVITAINTAKTTFINAVVGFSQAGFSDGTAALYRQLAQSGAEHNFGGGDTNKAVKKFAPDFYRRLVDPENKNDTVFTGGGTILTGFESKGVYQMKVIRALIENGGMRPN